MDDRETSPAPTAAASGATPTAARRAVRIAWRWIVRVVTWATAAAVVLGIAGQVVRDRNVATAMLMYIPAAPLGAFLIVSDLLRRGRTMRPRFMLTVLGLAGLVVGAAPMLGTRSPEPAPAGSDSITLLHWNMQSGGRWAAQPRWQRAADQILARKPDLIVLSEAPPDGWLFDSLRKVGGGYRTVHVSNEQHSRYWYKPLVCSKWPMEMEGQVPVRNGVAMSVAVRVRGRPLRLLVVDGVRQISTLRTPFLQDIAQTCDDAAKAGRPYDVVVGDFNAPGRSIGFDALRSAAGGFKRASDYSGGWRGTWPVPMPVYDIDHVLVTSPEAVTGCDLFSSRTLDTDHRGQLVTIAFPPGR